MTTTEQIEDKSLLKIIHLMGGREGEAMLTAWNKIPTYKSDCPTTRSIKEAARKDYARKLLNS